MYLRLGLLYKMDEEILKKIKQKGNKIRAIHSLRYFKTSKGEYGYGDVFWGLNNNDVRIIAKYYREIDFNIIKKLLDNKVHEVRMVGLLILVYKYEKANEELKKQIFEFYISNIKAINNWDLVDITCSKIVGDYLLNRDKDILYILSKSNNIWERRISIISTFSFIKHNIFNYSIDLALILLKDKEDLINKAVGWTLREIYKRDNKLIESFIINNYKDIKRTTLRYAIEKMSENKREYYLNYS